MSEEFFIQGNEACAKGALKAGCRFFAGYPITPSTEVAETLARELPKVGGSFVSDPVDCSPPDSSVRRVSRQEYWSGLPFPYPPEYRESFKSLCKDR